LETDLLIVLEQGLTPELLEDPGLGPLLETIMGSGGGSVTSREGTPRDAGEEDEKDGLHDGPIGSTRSTAEIPARRHGEEPLDAIPENIW
jgi:hypothetical protein